MYIFPEYTFYLLTVIGLSSKLRISIKLQAFFTTLWVKFYLQDLTLPENKYHWCYAAG